jgi:hypothetical protein
MKSTEFQNRDPALFWPPGSGMGLTRSRILSILDPRWKKSDQGSDINIPDPHTIRYHMIIFMFFLVLFLAYAFNTSYDMGTCSSEHQARYRYYRYHQWTIFFPMSKFQCSRIHDILEWIRIQGSMPLTNGSGSGCESGFFYFHQ